VDKVLKELDRHIKFVELVIKNQHMSDSFAMEHIKEAEKSYEDARKSNSQGMYRRGTQ